MKHFLILLAILALVGVYNTSVLTGVFFWTRGDRSYESEDFLHAEKMYEKGLLESGSGSIPLSADILYNIGNTLYRIGEQKEQNERTELWKKAAGAYAKSLSLRMDRDTEENLAFVNKKLQEEAKQKEQPETGTGDTGAKQEQGNPEGGTGSSQKEASGSDQTEEGQSGTGNTQEGSASAQNWSNGGSYNSIGWHNTDSVYRELSETERKEIGWYLEELKQFEKQNGRLLHPEIAGNSENLSDQLRNFFGSDSFFQDLLPGNDGKKDW